MAFGHVFLNDMGVLVCVVKWMLLLSIGRYSCVLHACLVVFDTVFSSSEVFGSREVNENNDGTSPQSTRGRGLYMKPAGSIEKDDPLQMGGTQTKPKP